MCPVLLSERNRWAVHIHEQRLPMHESASSPLSSESSRSIVEYQKSIGDGDKFFFPHPSLIVTSSGQRQDGELTKNLGRGKTSLQYLGIGFSFI